MSSGCMIERRLQREFEWAEFPAVLAEGLLHLHGAGVELAESVFSPPLSFLLGRYGHFHQRLPSTGRHRFVRWVRGQQRSSTKRPSPTSPSGTSTQTVRKNVYSRGQNRAIHVPSGSQLAVCQPAFLETATLAPGRRQRPHCQIPQIREASPPWKPSKSSGPRLNAGSPTDALVEISTKSKPCQSTRGAW